MKQLSDKSIDIINGLHTERLDYTSEYIPLIEAAQKLAAYEEIGLEPDEIITIINGASKEFSEYDELMSKHRIKELAQAEKAGRLVVLSAHGRWMPFHSDIAGDIQYCSVCKIGFEERTDFCPHCGTKMDLPWASLKKMEADNEAD